MESATNFKATTLSEDDVRVLVVSGGIESNTLGWKGISSSTDVMVASKDGPRGGRVREEDGSRRGVEALELRVEEGNWTRFARRKEKKAVADY
jgi:hypothetical protein